ncbi:ABC transporter permease [Geotoga petraea]|jgi:putative ABC transport system permease protein|uniref:ABC transporter permease n=1 Tax=Geotoga petraea TaxID=28234 RepID=A0A1G6IRA6_9BACT|nr:ABC transporter permease [Geotoga petraea]MDK2945711.1 putative tryptophan/tyrosine transport system permease protein [Geotoga sp.]TGG89279.1 ABC transporter permease [Geotoga petraea]SDC09027.1 putative ABC transport system permease protein [Geotoga petraea]
MDIISIFEQGLIASLAALGVFISFRVIDLPDLTPDGSYVLGAAVTISLLYANVLLPFAILLGALASGIAGLFTAFLYNKFNMHSLLASILIMTMLYSINLRIMDGPNISVPKESYGEEVIYEEQTKLDFLFEDTNNTESLVSNELQKNENFTNVFSIDIYFLLFISSIIIFLLYLLFKTEFGLALRGFGNNKEGIKNLGMNPNIFSYTGLFLGNFFPGLAGGFFAIYSGFSDVNMGQGIVVSSLAAVIIGEIVLGKLNILYNLLCAFIGGIIYQFVIALVMKYGYKIGFNPGDMKLLTSIFIILMIGLRNEEVKKWLSLKRLKSFIIRAR